MTGSGKISIHTDRLQISDFLSETKRGNLKSLLRHYHVLYKNQLNALSLACVASVRHANEIRAARRSFFAFGQQRRKMRRGQKSGRRGFPSFLSPTPLLQRFCSRPNFGAARMQKTPSRGPNSVRIRAEKQPGSHRSGTLATQATLALTDQSAMGNCASKLMEKSCVF